MLRYIALLWNQHSQTDQKTAEELGAAVQRKLPQWQCGFSTPGCSVHVPGSLGGEGDLIVMPNGGGALLGAAFLRSTSSDTAACDGQLRVFSHAMADQITTSRGKRALDRLWGSYVLIFSERNSGTGYVLRSPAGLLPCFYAQVHGVHLFFSVVDDYRTVAQKRLSINWPVIRAQAASGDYLTDETALTEIMSVEGGECVRISGSEMRRSVYWNPCTLSRESAGVSLTEAVSSIRRETLVSVCSWASRYKRILIELSGGLDSSIVLIGLTKSPMRADTYCATFCSTDCPGDDRHFARTMARKTGTTLIEAERDASYDISIFLRCERTARPALNFTGPGRFRVAARIAESHGCDAIFDGELGDNVFGFPMRAEPVADYLRRCGPVPGIVIVARDLARLRRLSIWRALLEGVSCARSESWLRSRYDLMKFVARHDVDSLRFVTKEVLADYEENAQRFCHPWFRDGSLPTLSSATLIQALIQTTSTALHLPFCIPGLPPYVHPLVSQPLVEAALRIPSNLAIKSGWNRAVARRAFSNELSVEVRQRSTKSQFDCLVRETVRRNAGWLREFLLDGVLAKEGVIDRHRVEQALSDRVNAFDSYFTRLFIQVYIEGWLRQWIA